MIDRRGRGCRRLGSRRALGIASAAAALLAGTAIAFAFDARARAGDVVEDIGSYLLRRASGDFATPVGTLHVNGLRLRIRSGIARAPVRDLLDGFDQRCRGIGAETAWTKQLPPGALGARIGRLLRPALRAERADGGYLACLDLHAREAGELAHGLQAFANDGDLAAIGDLRFVWALHDGEATAYVVVWSEGPLRIADAFPGSGDAPGADLRGIPRPPNGRRMLSAWQDGREPMLASYRVELRAPELATRYRRSLVDCGFVVRDGGGGNAAPRWLLAMRGDALTAVAIDAASSQGSTATLLRLQ